MCRCAKEVVSRLCQDQDWRDKVVNGTDAEWLEATNRLIKQYNLGLTNVREVLLHLGPTQPALRLDFGTADSKLRTVKQEEDI